MLRAMRIHGLSSTLRIIHVRGFRRNSRPVIKGLMIVLTVFIIFTFVGLQCKPILLRIKRWRNGPCRDRHFHKDGHTPEGVYIDVGAGDGRALRAFYQELPAEVGLPVIPCQYNPRDWSVFAIEADKQFSGILENMKLNYGFSLFKDTAVWFKNEELNLNMEQVGRTLDLNKWLRTNLSKEDFVVLRMNIGGSEYELLDKMLKNGSFCLIDLLIVYYHNRHVGRSSLLGPSMAYRIRTVAGKAACDVQILYEEVV
ncbi:uncharacterized protein LOC144345889 [Saccoglossus kowalevskii]